MATKINTVCGEIDCKDLGITLPHEHSLVDFRYYWKKNVPKESTEKEILEQPISLKNRGEVVYRPFEYYDNLYQLDINVYIEEAKKFKDLGGNTIVDLTSIDLGRRPIDLVTISEKTGLNIIMGSGYFTEDVMTEDFRNTTELEITKEIIREFGKGVKDTRIKPGIIGEVSYWDKNNPQVLKNIRASAKAQREIGCALNFHQPLWEPRGHEILDLAEKEGANLEKVVLSHCDPTWEKYDYHNSIAKRGVFIEYDLFGSEFMSDEGFFLPSDGDRIKGVKEQVNRGNIDHILISHDFCSKIEYTRWGGWGLGHILKHIVPRFKYAGLTEHEINIMLVENPKRLLSF